MRDHWDSFDDDWTPERRSELLSWNDALLRDSLLSSRAEFIESTQSDDEREQADEAQHAAQLDAATAEAEGIIGLSVARVLEWVGDDSVRARAALTVEQQTGDPRKSLIERLQARLSAPVA